MYIALEVRTVTLGMEVIIEENTWERLQTMSPEVFAKKLVSWAGKVELRRFRRYLRGAKMPVPKRIRFKKKSQVSTVRLL